VISDAATYVNTRRVNQFLYAAAATLAAGAVIVLVVGLTMPLDSSAPGEPARSSTSTDAAAASLPTTASLEPLWDLRLRSELIATASPHQPTTARLAADVAPAPSGVPVSLVGTIGDSLAILRHDSGQVDVRAAGENVAGVEVLEVRPARVRVRFNGQVVTLQKPLDAPGGL
jgi:hypothetical protein